MDKLDIFYRSKRNTTLLIVLIVLVTVGIIFVKTNSSICFSSAFAKAQTL